MEVAGLAVVEVAEGDGDEHAGWIALEEEAFLEGQYDTRFVERLLASETGSHRLRQAVEETP